MGVTSFVGYFGYEVMFRGAMNGASLPKMVLLGVMTGLSYQDIYDTLDSYGDLVAGGHEIAAGGGYTTGGKETPTPSFFTAAAPPNEASVSLGLTSFSNITATVKYVALIDPNYFDKVICFYDLDDLGGSLALAADNLHIDFTSSEAFTLVEV